MVYDKENGIMSIKRGYFVWTLPVIGVFIMALVAVTLQSCGVSPRPVMEPLTTLADVKKSLDSAWLALGITIVVGTIVSIFIYIQVTRLTKKLEKLGISA